MGIKVNVSDREAEAGERSPVPVGQYHIAVTKADLTSPQDGDNVGKPMIAFQLTIQESPHSTVRLSKDGPVEKYHNRNIFVNGCLWEGALYTIVGMLKAIGKYEDCLDSSGELDIPTEEEFWLGQQMYVRMALSNKQQKKFPDNPDYWIQASGFSAFTEEGAHTARATAAQSAEASLLP